MLIGLTGRASSGKDTVCQALLGYLPDRTVKRDAFADRLKISAARALGFGHGRHKDMADEELIEWMDSLKADGMVVSWFGADEFEISGREFLQFYGTEAHRQVFGDAFWVSQVLPNPDDPWYGRKDYFDDLVITDCRFENEAERVKDCGGQIWRIVRQDGEEVSHVSEEPLPQSLVDLTLYNKGTLDDLRMLARRYYVSELR